MVKCLASSGILLYLLHHNWGFNWVRVQTPPHHVLLATPLVIVSDCFNFMQFNTISYTLYILMII